MNYGEGRADILNWIEWDTFKVEANTYAEPLSRLFNQPMYQGKPKLETSMDHSMMLSLPQHFNVTSFQLAIDLMNNPEDVFFFRRYCRYEFWIGHKLFDSGPMSRFQWWREPSKDFTELLLVAKEQGLTFVGNEVEYRVGDNPIGHHILQAQTFHVRFIWDDLRFCPKQNFTVVAFLKGVLSRGVV